jgi:hypothetical protein
LLRKVKMTMSPMAALISEGTKVRPAAGPPTVTVWVAPVPATTLVAAPATVVDAASPPAAAEDEPAALATAALVDPDDDDFRHGCLADAYAAEAEEGELCGGEASDRVGADTCCVGDALCLLMFVPGGEVLAVRAASYWVDVVDCLGQRQRCEAE